MIDKSPLPYRQRLFKHGCFLPLKMVEWQKCLEGDAMENLNRVLEAMKKESLPQLIVSDPMMIYYLIGLKIAPGERMLALYLHESGKVKLFVNDLFRQENCPVELQYYNDIDDCVGILAESADKNLPIGIDKNWSAGFLLRLQALGFTKCVNSSFLIDAVRRVKTGAEQEKMRICSRLNDAVMERMVRTVSTPHTEKELDAIIRGLYKDVGCDDVSFQPILSFGVNAADPHHEPDDTAPKYGDCLVIDIGGIKEDYCSDMTRTVFLGEVSPRQAEIYEIVKEANRRGIAAAKPGARMRDVDNAARSYIESKGFGKYFTHRTGHSIGLEVHEAGDVSAVNDAAIVPGQVFSVEPGIYIPEEKIGVRIEDLVLITPDGCEVLNHYSKELTVVPFNK